jgi:hypothetical protein
VKIFPFAILLSLAGVASADTQGKVQPNPSQACIDKSFKPHELCFATPKDGVARSEYLSEPFYAVILRSAERCTITEQERIETQRLFPERKVFSVRFYCDENVEENISYTNVNDKVGFLAVYAGRTLPEANALLAKVKAAGHYAGANVRRMQAKLVYP